MGSYFVDGSIISDPSQAPMGKPFFDLERIAANADRFLRYEDHEHGVFALETHVVHPDTIIPRYMSAGIEEHVYFQAIVACGDRRNRSEWVWLKAREYFAEHPITEIPSWNEEQRVHFADSVNSGLRDKQDGGVTYDPRPVFAVVQSHLLHRGGVHLDVPASVLSEEITGIYGVGEQVARAAAQWLGDAGYLFIDPAFIAKVDLHDIRHMLIGGELFLNGASPHHKTLDSLGGLARKAACEAHGIPIERLKKDVWAPMRDVSSSVDRRKGSNYIAEAVRLLSTYYGVWDEMGFWRRGKGHKIQKERGALEQMDLLEERRLESPGTYLKVREFPLERVQGLIVPGQYPHTPETYLSDGLHERYLQEGLIPDPSHQLHLLSA